MNDVICTGLPKTGTHSALKAVNLLGLPSVASHKKEYISGKMICMYRHPRNTLVSWVRFVYPEVLQGFLILSMNKYFDGGDFCSEYRAYDILFNNKDVLTVKYEDLVRNDDELKIMAEYLEVPYLDDAFKNLPGLTETWTGSPSNWEDVWTEEIDAAWKGVGGYELEKEYGY